MNMARFKNLNTERKLFILFLLIHLTVWSAIGLIRTVLPTDALEGIYWGSLHDFGTPKHPPLAGWISYFVYNLFRSDFSIYLLSQLIVCLGSIYMYKLAKFFISETQAIMSVFLMEGCWVYSYITGYYGFNPDVILLFTLPIIAYYFYKCMSKNNPSDWIKLGVIVGLAFLNKYQTGMIIICMALWAFIFNRETFKNKYFYLSVFIAFLIFLPHLLWLVKYDFFPFMYFENELSSPVWYNHLTAPLMFIVMQIAVIIGVIALFIALKLRFKSKFHLRDNYNNKDKWFLLLLGLGPIIIHIIMGMIEGGTMRPRWGFEFWFMLSIMLFYFFPAETKEREFIFSFKLGITAMFITFLALGTLLSVEKNYRSRYPVYQLLNDFEQIWAENTNKPLKYLGGYIEWTLPLTIYGNSNYNCILDTFGYKNPWVDEKDLKLSGALIIDRTKDKVSEYTRKSCPYLPEDYSVNPIGYSFTVKNAFNGARKYDIYYFIVPPEEK